MTRNGRHGRRGPFGAISLALLASVAGSSLAAPDSEAVAAAEDPVDFATQIRPLLSDRCFPCHGPDAGSLQANLRLDLRDSATEDRGGYAAIVPGDVDHSELVYRITSAEAGELMPPEDSQLTLSEDEQELLKRWVAEGAEYAEHWSFLRPERSALPALVHSHRALDPIDHYLKAGGMDPQRRAFSKAQRAILLRRVSYDLTGLPPTVAELDAYLEDMTEGSYERAVDRLLASHAHAERMTADWLDTARYADTFGYQSDVDMNVWPWRDWVLRAFTSNLPYDEFVVHQLAGDLLQDATAETRLATTFNRLHRQTNEGGSVEEEFRAEYVADRVETMSAAFLGLTVGCARCHDHKFDPISQRDFYELSSFFDDIDESGLYSHFTNAVPTPALDLPTEDQARRLAELEEAVEAAEQNFDATFFDLRKPMGWFSFNGTDPTANAIEGGGAAELVDAPKVVDGADGRGFELSGENAIRFPGIGDFHRSDPFSIALNVNLPAYERAVVIHRTKSWTDSGSRGYQVLVEDGHLTVALVHFWPGDAIAIRTREPIATDTWVHVAFTYDGSSRADGLALYLDGVRQNTEVVRDHLTRSIRGGGIDHLTIGSRFRDKGLKGGRVDDVVIFDRELHAFEVPTLIDRVDLTSHHEAATGMTSQQLNHDVLRANRRARDDLRDQIRQIMTMAEAPALEAAQRQAHVLKRGDYSQPGDPVEPALLDALPALGFEDADDRLDLARWLTHPDHPLTARVHVDRLWRMAFGYGLLETPEDLGSQGPVPDSPELLDNLARDLIDSGWDSRAMLRRFVLSATYRQWSFASGQPAESGPPEWGPLGFSRHQLPAEMIRDGLLHAAGLLVPKEGGPPVFPYQPPGLWKEKSGRVYPTSRGDDLRRRSLYTFWRRTSPPPTMSMFDVPGREVCTVKRQLTTTPSQVLALWNDPQFVEIAVALGARAIAAGPDDGDRVTYLMRALTSRHPTKAEQTAIVKLVKEQRIAFRADPAGARALAEYDLEAVSHPPEAPVATPDGSTVTNDMIERAAWAIAASAMLGLDSVVTRR